MQGPHQDADDGAEAAEARECARGLLLLAAVRVLEALPEGRHQVGRQPHCEGADLLAELLHEGLQSEDQVLVLNLIHQLEALCEVWGCGVCAGGGEKMRNASKQRCVSSVSARSAAGGGSAAL